MYYGAGLGGYASGFGTGVSTGGYSPGMVDPDQYFTARTVGAAQNMPSFEERYENQDLYNPEIYLKSSRGSLEQDRVLGQFMNSMYYNPEGTPGEDQYVWRDVWDAEQEQLAQQQQSAYDSGIRRLMGYSNLANQFASRGFGPGSGLYYGGGTELQEPAPRGDYAEMLQSLISQFPGGQ